MITRRLLLPATLLSILLTGWGAGVARAQTNPAQPSATPQVPSLSAPVPASPPAPPPTVPPQTVPAPPAPPSPPNPATQENAAAAGSAEDGGSEKFYADFTTVEAAGDGSQRVSGWDDASNAQIDAGRVAPAKAGQPMGLAKALSTEGPTTLMTQAMMYFGAASAPNDSNCLGFNNAKAGARSNSPAQRFAVCLGNNSAYLLNGGKVTPLNKPDAAGFVSVTMWLRANGNLSTSLVQSGSNGAVTNTLAGIVPPPNLTNFEISGMSANDRQYASRYAVSRDDGPEHIDMAYDGGEHPGGAAVFTTDTAGGVFALIPPDYKPGAANRAVIYLHGLHERGWSISCQAPYTGCNAGVAKVALGLMKAGYVVIGINGANDACYGNETCVEELRSVLAEYQQKLAIGGGLFGFADSMGGFQMLNAIAQGVFTPRAMAACCLNTNLADDYFPDYKAPGSTKVAREAGTAKGLIDAAYKITPENPYETATTGYDPMLASGEALERLAKVPAMFWASAGDRAVNRTFNSDQYAAMVNAAGGNASVTSCHGDHEDLSCFDPEALVTFFGQH